jgi:formylglycine-generating enzyme required for sulfatase activity
MPSLFTLAGRLWNGVLECVRFRRLPLSSGLWFFLILRAFPAVLILALFGGIWSCGSRTSLGLIDEAAGDGSGPDIAAPDGGDGCDEAGDASTNDVAPDSVPDGVVADSGSPPLSCSPGGAGMTDCGPGGSGSESCCTSLEVIGGMFYRSYDDVTYTDDNYPATVSSFRLDKYEVTVGRFRQFVSALMRGWLPAPGSGKHSYLNGGRGLENSANPGTYESGWVTAGDSSVAPTNGNLACGAGPVTDYPTWTPVAGNNETKPINCMNWYEAYAFCIWDGGFLPSEAEWNYAAAGGGSAGGQRAYPWSSPSTSTTIDCRHANYDPGSLCFASGVNNVGSESPAGDGRYGHADLAGNVFEWNLDSWGSYLNPCTDCANLSPAPSLVLRGGSFLDHPSAQLVSDRSLNGLPVSSNSSFGIRCARAR